MDDRFAEAMRDREVVKDTRLLGDFAVIYCNGVHAGSEKRAVKSDGAALGVYGRKVPVVCVECAELLAYAEKRRALCPRDPKPFCSVCDTHCYRPDMREPVREVMRYAGPRSMWHGHAIDGVRHLIEGRKARRVAATRAAARGEETGRKKRTP